jgi:CTP:molybdopterin cytidylyltransferase MocA
MPIKLMSTGNEAVTTEMIRNMQFDYMRYLVKSADLQKMVYTASQTALPEVVKQWQAEGKDNSAFDEFFNRWLTAVERKTVEVMRTDEYANLQSETAQAGLAVKQNMDGIIEMSLADLPIATRTEMADIAMEMSALRHKIMELEKEVKHLRKAHGTTNAVISTTSEQNTTKSGKSKKV